MRARVIEGREDAAAAASADQAQREARRAMRRERRYERRLERARRRAARGPARRLRLGHFLPALLTGVINTAAPLALIAAELATLRAAAERATAREAYLAQVRFVGPDCALELEKDTCLCGDFITQSQASAYVAAQQALLGRAPRGRVGLFVDGADVPCAHLDAR